MIRKQIRASNTNATDALLTILFACCALPSCEHRIAVSTAHKGSAFVIRGSSQSRLLVPLSWKPVLVVLIARRYGMTSLLSFASYLGLSYTFYIRLDVLFHRAEVGSASK